MPQPVPAALPADPQGFRHVTFAWGVAFLASFGLYALTANRGAQWQDSGAITLRICQGEWTNPLGLALAHPLHAMLGRAAMFLTGLEPAFAVTLVSALGAALAVANVWGCVLTITRHWPAALFAAGSLAVANTFWKLATITEVYTLSVALLTAELWCLLVFTRGAGRYALWGMLLFNGLGIANHLQAGLTTPVLLVVMLHAWRAGRIRAQDMLIGAVVWLLGTLPYSVLVAEDLVRTGDLFGTLQSALVGRSYGKNVLNASLSPRLLGVSVAFVLFNFPNLLLPAAGYGIARGRAGGMPSAGWRALLAGLVLHAVFAFRYNVVDQHTFFLPIYVFLCIFGGVGAAVAWQRLAGRRRAWITAVAFILLALTPLMYWGAATILRRAAVFEQALHNKPYRDDYEYLLIPWSVVDTSAERMSRQAIELAGDNGLIIVEDGMAQFAIAYQALRSDAEDIDIRLWPKNHPEAQAELLEAADQHATAGGAIVLVPLDRDAPVVPPPTGAWERKGDLYVLDPRDIPAGMGTLPE